MSKHTIDRRYRVPPPSAPPSAPNEKPLDLHDLANIRVALSDYATSVSEKAEIYDNPGYWLDRLQSTKQTMSKLETQIKKGKLQCRIPTNQSID